MRSFRELVDDPEFMYRVTCVLIPLSLIEWAVATFTHWVNSVAYVSHLSQLTFSISLIPWWQGLRVELRQMRENVAIDVVHEIVDKTEVSANEKAKAEGIGEEDPAPA